APCVGGRRSGAAGPHGIPLHRAAAARRGGDGNAARVLRRAAAAIYIRGARCPRYVARRRVPASSGYSGKPGRGADEGRVALVQPGGNPDKNLIWTICLQKRG